MQALRGQEQWLRSRSVKAWGDWSECLADHRMFMALWPAIFGAYIGPNALEPAVTEAVMITVNSVNACTFCSGLCCCLMKSMKMNLSAASTPATLC